MINYDVTKKQRAADRVSIRCLLMIKEENENVKEESMRPVTPQFQVKEVLI
jgi:hypothetical protein